MAARNPQVDALVENYHNAVEDAKAARKANLEAKAKVRNLRSTIETLVEYGVVAESVFAEEDAENENSTDNE